MKILALIFVIFFSYTLLNAQNNPVQKELEVVEEQVMEEEPPPPPPIASSSQTTNRYYGNQYSWHNNYGTVKRLYPSDGRFMFSLSGGRTAMNPKSGYYEINKSHSNYEALVDVLIMAAETRTILKVRTQEQLNQDGFAQVVYLVLDY